MAFDFQLSTMFTFLDFINQGWPLGYLKRTRLTSLPPPGKVDKVMYTPDSACTIRSFLSVCTLVPWDKFCWAELLLDSLAGAVVFVLWLSVEYVVRTPDGCLAVEPEVKLGLAPSGDFSAIFFNCNTNQPFKIRENNQLKAIWRIGCCSFDTLSCFIY